MIRSQELITAGARAVVKTATSLIGLGTPHRVFEEKRGRDLCSGSRHERASDRRTDREGDWLRDYGYTALGPGLLESTYRDALFIELTLAGFKVAREHPVVVMYRGQRVRGHLRIDLLVDGRAWSSKSKPLIDRTRFFKRR